MLWYCLQRTNRQCSYYKFICWAGRKFSVAARNSIHTTSVVFFCVLAEKMHFNVCMCVYVVVGYLVGQIMCNYGVDQMRTNYLNKFELLNTSLSIQFHIRKLHPAGENCVWHCWCCCCCLVFGCWCPYQYFASSKQSIDRPGLNITMYYNTK